MDKLNRTNEAYFVKIDDTIIYHYDCNRKYYWDRNDVECGTIDTTRIDKTNTKTIIIDPLFANYKPSGHIDLFFSNLSKLEKIIGLEYFNTSEITSMSYMFEGCSSLKELDLRGFNTSNVRFMVGMFFGCFKLKNINLSNFDTSNVINLSGMFWGCESLTSLDVSKFNTSNVTDMHGMFWGCKSLTSLDVSNFNTSNVTDMSYMFRGCKSLTSLDLSKFNTASVTDMSGMFAFCKSLTSLDLSSFNISSVGGAITRMFDYCKNLETIYVGKGWDMSKVNKSSWVPDDDKEQNFIEI